MPLTLAEAKKILSETEEEAFEESVLSGYRIAEVGTNYAGIPQRWLIVESEARRQAANEQMDRRLLESEKQLRKRLKLKEDFECEADALKAASAFAKELRHHMLTELRLKSELRHDKPGRPSKDASPRKVYSVEATLSLTRQP